MAAGRTARRRSGRGTKRAGGRRFEIDPEDVRRGLGKLVLTVIEIIRELLERQAVRRVSVGDLDEDAADRLGLALARLRREVERLKRYFDLEDEDFDLKLGDLLELR